MTIYCGIDFGMSKSTVSVINFDENTEQTDIIKSLKTVPIYQLDGQKNILKDDMSLPSYIYFDLDENSVYTGRYAKELYAKGSKSNQTVASIKDRLGEDITVNILYNQKNKAVDFSTIECASILLKTIKHSLELQFKDEEIKEAVVTIPSEFSIEEQKSIKRAMMMAGFKKVHLLDEISANILYYLNECYNKWDGINISKGEKIYRLVCDIGSKFTNIGVIEIFLDKNNKLDYKIIGQTRRINFGGDDFDKYLGAYFLSRFEQDEMKLEDMSDSIKNKVLHRILYLAEKEKIAINDKIKTCLNNKSKLYRIKKNINLEVIDGKYITDLELNYKNLHSIFEELVFASYSNIITSIDYTIRDANINKTDIYEVLLSGGMSGFYLIEEALEKYFGSTTRFVFLDNESSMSKGAAIHHFNLNQKGLINLNSLKSKIENDIYINLGDDFCLLIPKNVKLEEEGTLEYKIKKTKFKRDKLNIDLYYKVGALNLNYRWIYNKFISLDKDINNYKSLNIKWKFKKNKKININIKELDIDEEIDIFKALKLSSKVNCKIKKLILNGDEIKR